MTLVALLALTTGARADIAIGDVYKFGSQIDFGSTSVWRLTVSGVSGDGKGTISGSFTLGYGGYNNGNHQLNFPTGTGCMFLYIADDNSAEPWGIQVSGGDGSYENPYTFSAIYEAPLIYHSLSDDKWIVTMPAGNVTVEPEYYAQAMFATDGNEVLTPTAAEDAIAGTDAPLIEEGTVAKAGQTDDAQGQVMYAVTTTADAAPALDAFSATVPTAEDYDDATTVFVWYYIQGADAPTGTVPSDDNTFSDSDISGTPLQVNVLSNKFDIQFNAANANTIEAGKATVTVGGTAATVTEGKLQGVKMGSEVKMTAKDGYKFRKVEVKKAGPALKTLTVNGVATKSIYYAEGDTWQQAIERPENAGSGWSAQGDYIVNGGYTLLIGSGYVRPGHTIDATKNYSLEAD